MNTDGNTDAINRHIDELEAYYEQQDADQELEAYYEQQRADQEIADLRDDVDALAAKLADVEAERDHWETVAIARQAKQQTAEAALRAVYRLGLGAGANAVDEIIADRIYFLTRARADDEQFSETIRALPTLTAAELMARIQTGEKE